jgi:gliding motility-associated-like protein
MNNLAAGTYSLTVTDANGCKSLSIATINSSTKPDAKFTYVPSVSCDGLVVNFKDESTPSNISSWTWNFGDGTTDYIQNPAHVFPYSSGSYPVVLVVSLPPCKDTMKYDVPVGDLFIYTTFDENTNVFTPNNDKVNDCFIPSLKGNGADKLKDCVSIEVYDRWGIKMFESNGKDNCWNGNNIQNNKPAVDGVYFYIAKLATKTIKGSITLIRNKP